MKHFGVAAASLASLASLAGCPADAADFRPARLTTGEYVLIATWPEGADKLCFVEDVSTAPLGCTTTHVQIQSGMLTIQDEALQFKASASDGASDTRAIDAGYVLTPLTGTGLRRIRAVADNAAGRSDGSSDLFVIVFRPAPPELLDRLESQLQGASQTIQELRQALVQ